MPLPLPIMEAPPLPNLPTKPPLATTTPPHKPPATPPSPYTTRLTRRFPAAAPHYPLPCDHRELSRQALHHELLRTLLPLHLSPPPPAAAHILDLGCGTALWTADLATTYPAAHITGLDAVPVHTDMAALRFTFVPADFTHPLPFPPASFDRVFLRDVALGLRSGDLYAGVMAEVMRVLRPGGVVEVLAVDTVVRCLRRQTEGLLPGVAAYSVLSSSAFEESRNPYVRAYNERVVRGLGERGVSASPCTLMKLALVNEGFAGVEERRLAVPLDEVWWEEGGREEGRRRRREGVLTEAERAVRGLARWCFVQMVEGLEEVLRGGEGGWKEDEWERWYRELMWNWMEGGGLRGGECLEYGVWWGTKP